MGSLRRREIYREVGKYSLPYGKHEVTFFLDYQPSMVLISDDSYGYPVCQGDINYFSTFVVENGFTIVADIKTDYADLIWVTVVGER